ncbi:MAG: right-handed parallel beta-helix repeat-containing protein [Planctomycetes bacterium]|nr:right-handed parallel beta-helix repeat-containing protein [Planctomycetota bacterium]
MTRFHRMHCVLRTALTAVVLSNTSLLATDYYVDGLRGIDQPAGGSATQPWKSIDYALARVGVPTTGRHRILIAGAQTYTLSGSLRLASNVDLEGIGVGSQRPILTVPTNASGLVHDRYEDLTLELRRLIVTGGRRAVELGTRPRLDLDVVDCSFSGQSEICLEISGNQVALPMQVEIRGCDFANSPLGLKWGSSFGSSNMIVERCAFDRAPMVCTAGYVSYPSRCTFEIDNCVFLRCADAALSVRGWNAPEEHSGLDLRVRRCAFRDNRVGCSAEVELQSRIEVSESTFFRHETAVHIVGRGDTRDHSADLSRNVIRQASSTGIDVSLFHGKQGPSSWLVTTESNIVEDCEVGIQVAIDLLVQGLFIASGDSVRDSRSLAMSIAGTSSLFHANLVNAFLLRSRGSALKTGGKVPIRCKHLTIADCGRVALDLGTNPVAIDHTVFDDNLAGDVIGASSVTVDSCCSSRTKFQGAGNLMTDPKLTRPSYRLESTSPCIGAGNPQLAAPFDFEGDLRDPHADLGADEVRAGFSTSRFGAPMPMSRNGFQPRISTQDRPSLGTSFDILLSGAMDGQLKNAPGAVLLVGLEGHGPTFDVPGLPGGVLYVLPFFNSMLLPIKNFGSGVASLPIPDQPALSGTSLAAQWIVVAPGANDVGAMVTGGLRFVLGR